MKKKEFEILIVKVNKNKNLEFKRTKFTLLNFNCDYEKEKKRV